MLNIGPMELIILLVICIVPLVLAAILVWALLTASSRRAKATRKCPYCAETIKADAAVCRYCGRDVAPVQVDTV